MLVIVSQFRAGVHDFHHLLLDLKCWSEITEDVVLVFDFVVIRLLVLARMLLWTCYCDQSESVLRLRFSLLRLCTDLWSFLKVRPQG